MKTRILLFILLSLILRTASAQSCTPQGDQTTYGTNNVWRGYVYQGLYFKTYKGYVTEGTAASANFNESFGGSQVTYNTNGCSVYTDTFCVRYKLLSTLVGNYDITIGGDDGVRLSVDGGATWLINGWVDQGYTTYTTTSVHFNGNTQLVLEYYEDMGANQVSFTMTPSCVVANDDQTVYGSNNIWNGFIYQGMNFNTYKGKVFEGSAATPNFNENFGGSGSPITYNTSSCSVQTAQFSARYRLAINLGSGRYTFTVGGDDGFRFSLDGGNTWVINQWQDQGYTTSTYSANLAGSYNMVIEYYQNGGYNQVSFAMSGGTILPLTLTGLGAELLAANKAMVQWKTMMETKVNYYGIERSSDGISFTQIAEVPSKSSDTNTAYSLSYSFTDAMALPGNSYYRLHIVDMSGNDSYSQVVTLSNTEWQGTKIFPTLLQTNALFVETDKNIPNARLEIFDLQGRRISESAWSVLNGRQTVNINNIGLAKGMYVARLTSNGQSILNQMIVWQAN